MSTTFNPGTTASSSHQPGLPVSCSRSTAAAMVALMVSLGERSGLSALDLRSDQFLLLLASAVVGIALGHVLFYTSLIRLGVAISAGVLQLPPFLVSGASYFLFEEILTVGQWTGGCVAVIGAALILAVQRRLGDG